LRDAVLGLEKLADAGELAGCFSSRLHLLPDTRLLNSA